jgi:dual specificity phosphatase 12
MDPEKVTPSVNEIMPGLWLGNEAASQSEEFMRQAGICYVVNATRHIPCKFATIKYIRVPVNDPGANAEDPRSMSENETMLRHLPGAVAFIHRAQMEGKPILVHCHAGAQRSAAIVTAYICHCFGRDMRRRRLLNEIIRAVIKQRPRAFFGGESINFYNALLRYIMQ